MTTLPIPEHFDASKVGEVWRVPYQEQAEKAVAWSKNNKVKVAASDETRICLLMIDCQNTFCIPGFELFVAGESGNGAVEDNVRLCEFIYRNLGAITEIAPTLDTHMAMQIFHCDFFVDEKGCHPPPMTPITLSDVQAGRWGVNPAVASNLADMELDALQEYVIHYCRRLEEAGKYTLMVWPYHAMLGGIGHALVSAIEEACFFHSIARCSQTAFEIKGNHPLTENYSVLRPEVMDDGADRPIAEKNVNLIRKLLDFDMVIVAGQAKSHCVAWTVDDLLAEIKLQDESLATKVYLLEDCTSAVVVPGVVDFTSEAELAFQRFADAGMNIVHSTDPIETWPGVYL